MTQPNEPRGRQKSHTSPGTSLPSAAQGNPPSRSRTAKPKATKTTREPVRRGRLRIGDQANAIRIIAMSQGNPLKAIAEFVENSIDAKASRITLVRGKEDGEHFLRIVDDGAGVRLNEDGVPDFEYVATHICDSIKRRLKAQGSGEGLQGEFGIGLLGFWSLGESLVMRSGDQRSRPWQLQMTKGSQAYQISKSRSLLAQSGTEVDIRPLHASVRALSAEKIQAYLAAELRNRLLDSKVRVLVQDRSSRSELEVVPRFFEGRKLALPALEGLQAELYVNEAASDNQVALSRGGTRVLESVTELAELSGGAWASGFFQGYLDVPGLQLTPGTRSGIIRDLAFDAFVAEATKLTPLLEDEVRRLQQAREEKASRETLLALQRAFREGFLGLPDEDYDWFRVELRERRKSEAGLSGQARQAEATVQDSASGTGELPPTQASDFTPGDSGVEARLEDLGEAERAEPAQRSFFDFAGPLHSVRISPSSSVLAVGATKKLRAVARDRSHREVTEGIHRSWKIISGEGTLQGSDGSPAGGSEFVEFQAPTEPGLCRIELVVRQGELERTASALLTVTDRLQGPSATGESAGSRKGRGLPEYTFERAPAELWRSRFDAERNLIVINNGHRDFIFVSSTQALKLRYICRLFAKELVLANFPGESPGALLERLIEVSLHVEEKLRSAPSKTDSNPRR